MALLSLAAVVVAAALPRAVARSPAGPPPHDVTMTRVANGLWTVPVTLAGEARPRRFVVDTGSERTVIAADTARAMSLTERPGPILLTPTGRVEASAASLDRVAVGGLVVAPLAVVVADLRELGRGWPMDGVLGMDVLGGRDLLIDFAGARLTMGDARGARGGTPLATRSVGGRRVVAARVNGRPRDLVLDTGAAALVVFDAADAGELVAIGAIGASMPARRQRAEVAVGRVHLGGVPVVRVPLTALRTGSEGLLPGTLFSRIFIAADADEVRVVPRR